MLRLLTAKDWVLSITGFFRCSEEEMELRARIRYFPNVSVSRKNFTVDSVFGRSIHKYGPICACAHFYLIKMY